MYVCTKYIVKHVMFVANFFFFFIFLGGGRGVCVCVCFLVLGIEKKNIKIIKKEK